MKKNFFSIALLHSLALFSISQKGYDKWFDKHVAEYGECIKKDMIENRIYGQYQAGLITFDIETKPILVKSNKNFYFTEVFSSLTGKDSTTYALYVVKEQINPYKISCTRTYSCDSLSCIPAPALFYDIKKSKTLLKDQSLTDQNIHIRVKKMSASKNTLQEWIYYNKEKNRSLDVLLIPDGKGGTFFFFSKEESTMGVDLELGYKEGLKGLLK